MRYVMVLLLACACSIELDPPSEPANVEALRALSKGAAAGQAGRGRESHCLMGIPAWGETAVSCDHCTGAVDDPCQTGVVW